MKRLWKVKTTINGFELILMVRGTEEELQNYLYTEFPRWSSYIGATKEDENAATALGMKIYLASDL